MKDCIVVGGGLIGMLTVRALRQAGLDVSLLEKAQLGGESTWAGGGILSPLYPWRYPDAVNALAKYSQQVYPEFAEALLAETGIDPEYTKSGLLVLDQNEAGAANAWASEWGMSLQNLQSAEKLGETEAALNSKFTSALYFPDIAQMRNPRLVKALRASLDQQGIEYHEHTAVTELVISNNKVRAVKTKQGLFQAGRVVIAGGAWSAKILADYIEPPEIAPVKGQMILYRARPG
jgi:glycine oxidase